jgi:glutamine amidotransferase
MIVIVDHGMGNLYSIINKLRRLAAQAIISSRPEDVEKADKIVLPSVGFLPKGCNLKSLGLVDMLNYKVLDNKTPILGICLGMQLLTQRSEEGKC